MLCRILTAARDENNVMMVFQDGERTETHSNDVQVKGKEEIAAWFVT